ncbi:restriction endonuclease subunit S [Pseudomonas caspiana]|uniref:restriction endonuclease subunit S n=1 Tax=Pseudomonas caspiana TaxID=1451454 RepID=UPI0032ECB142
MSSEWPITPLSDLITVKHGFAFKGEFFSDEPSPFQLTTPGNFAVGGGFQLGKGKYYSGPIFSDYVLSQGDLIVTMTDLSKAADTLGFSAIVPETRGTTWLHNQRVGRVLIKSVAQVHKDFLHYLMRTNDYRQWVVSGATGSTVKHTSPDRICTYQFPLPPLNTQRAIAEALSALDNRITLLRETNATLEDIAQALFQSWFVNFDPVRAKAEGLEPEGMGAATAALFPDSFEESGQAEVPRGWKMSTLGAICELNGGVIQTGPFGSQLHASDYVAEGVPVVMPKDISGRRVDATTAARILPKDADRLSRHKLRGGDIVFSRRGDVEKHALIGYVELGWLCGTGCLLVRPGALRNVSGYLSRSLDLRQTKQWLTQHAVGATMPNLNTGILSAVPILLPADEVLASFERVVSVLDERISESNATAQTLTQLRDTLLPRLISGQLRLPDAELLVKDSCA